MKGGGGGGAEGVVEGGRVVLRYGERGRGGVVPDCRGLEGRACLRLGPRAVGSCRGWGFSCERPELFKAPDL